MRRTAPGEFALETDERFWNQIGPFGGWLAAAAMRAMRDELAPAWQPRSFHAHFVGALARGELRVRVQELRRQRTVLALRAEICAGLAAGRFGGVRVRPGSRRPGL